MAVKLLKIMHANGRKEAKVCKLSENRVGSIKGIRSPCAFKAC